MTTYSLAVQTNGPYDGDYVVKQYTTLTIGAGNTLTTAQPCKGLFIYVQGDCTINGTLSMRSRGAAVNPDSVTGTNGLRYPVRMATGAATLSSADFQGCGSDFLSVIAKQPGISGDGKIIQLPKRGANGGASVTNTNTGNAGSAGAASGSDTISVTLGGGGGGGAYIDGNSCAGTGSGTCVSGRGGNATCFSGGVGGGAKMSGLASTDSSATNGDDNGGAGGQGGNGHCGGDHSTLGGVGNPGGTDQYSSSNRGYGTRLKRADSGTGGVIWLIVGGNLTIGPGGVIDVRGTDQTNHSGNRTTGGIYGVGGPSGGGAAILLYKGNYSSTGSILTTGGTQVIASDAGPCGVGGNGSFYIAQIL